MNFRKNTSLQEQSKCYYYTRKYKNKHMAGGARCAQPGLPPTTTNLNRPPYFRFGGNRTLNLYNLYNLYN